jgi:hypothetical protein
VAALAPEAQGKRTERVLHRERGEHLHLGRVAGGDRHEAGQNDRGEAEHDEILPGVAQSIAVRAAPFISLRAPACARVLRAPTFRAMKIGSDRAARNLLIDRFHQLREWKSITHGMSINLS